MTNLISANTLIPEALLLGVLLVVHYGGFAKKRLEAPTLICAEVGLRSGLKLSLLYALAFYLFFMGSLFLAPSTSSLGQHIADFVVVLILYLPLTAFFAGVLGVLPACLLGYFSGLIIGAVLPMWKGLTTLQAKLIGGAVTANLAFVLNLVVLAQWDSTDTSFLNNYWVLIGIPCLIYVGWGVWMGRFVERQILHPTELPQAQQSAPMSQPL